MNYLELINQYWDLREQGILTANEGDYYLFLLHKCNRLSWKNPFNLSNQLCCGYLGIQEKSLIKYRNKLKQVGLIDFKSGTKGANTEYSLNIPCKNYSELGSLSGSQTGSKSGSLSGEKTPDNIKHKPEKTKLNKSHLPADAAPKGKNEKTEFWEQLVEAWFVFYEKKFFARPVFKAADGKHLKTIITNLRKSAESRVRQNGEPIVWDEPYAIRAVNYFFEKAFNHDEWFKQNFELGNMASKYNSITNTQQNGNNAIPKVNKGNTEAIYGSNKDQNAYAGGF